MKKLVNNEIVDMTAEEIAEREAQIAKEIADNTSFAEEAQAKIDLQASAKAKLIAGEALTEDEANTIVL